MSAGLDQTPKKKSTISTFLKSLKFLLPVLLVVSLFRCERCRRFVREASESEFIILSYFPNAFCDCVWRIHKILLKFCFFLLLTIKYGKRRLFRQNYPCSKNNKLFYKLFFVVGRWGPKPNSFDLNPHNCHFGKWQVF